MLVSHSRTLGERARHLATQARDPAPHYEHSDIGFNYRMSNLLAAIGRGSCRRSTRKSAAVAPFAVAINRSWPRLGGIEFLADANLRLVERVAHLRHCRRARVRRVPRTDPAAPGRRRTSSRARCGSRCIFSLCSGLPCARRFGGCAAVREGTVPAERLRPVGRRADATSSPRSSRLLDSPVATASRERMARV